MRQIPLYLIKRPCKQVAQIMRKYLAWLDFRLQAELLHVMEDVRPVHGPSAAGPKDDSALNSPVFNIRFEFPTQLLLQYNRAVLEPGGIDHSEASRNNQSKLI